MSTAGDDKDLAARFRRLIERHGPMPVSRYMGESNALYYDSRDPLGRDQSADGTTTGEGPLALGQDGAGRARELLDEIRRRSGETERPEAERDYLNRLLERF